MTDSPFRLPASFAQERLWLLDRIEPGDPFYNVPSPYRLDGPLDVPTLRRALDEIIARHEALRTTFELRDGRIWQVVAPPAPLTMPSMDLSHEPPGERDETVRTIAREAILQPFDLGTGPLVRASLLRLGGEQHVLLLTIHHIVFDGWSAGVLLSELAALYDAFVHGRPSPLAELTIQYADFAHWQRARLTGELLDRQLAIWTERLAGAPPLLELPYDRPRPAVQSFAGGAHYFEIPATTCAALRDLAGRSGTTTYMVALAAWAMVLRTYSGRDDLLVGNPIANRNRSELEPLIGFFVNLQALRLDLSGDVSFAELLVRVRTTTLEAYDNQDLPFEKLVEALAPRRDLGANPIVQIVFAMHNAPVPPVHSGALTMHQSPYETGSVRFDLETHLWPVDDELRGCIVYKTDLFDGDRIARMARHFRTVLDAAVRAPDRPISAISLLDDVERETLLTRFNATTRPYPSDATIHKLLDAVTQGDREATAVVDAGDGGARLSYDELLTRARRMAAYLRARGIARGARVAVMLPRSAQLIVTLAGVLESGAAYVPLDPTYPGARIAFMLADSGATVLVTDPQHADDVSSHMASAGAHAIEVVCLDDATVHAIARGSDAPIASGARAEDPAYVMYTSGSTGRPKGVVVSHRAVVRLVRGVDYVTIRPADVFLQLAPVAFDASTFEIWGPLLNGARLAVMPHGLPSLAEIAAALREHDVSILWLTATLFHLMVDNHLDDLATVRQVVAGGEVLSVPHARRMLRALGPDGVLVNGYGPTEGTTFSACYRMSGDADFDGPVPIGRPISNTQMYVLDERLEPTPIGVPGEIYIAGDGLALGYHGRPALTAERFVPNPRGPRSGRMYRTGDVGCFLPDGVVRFLGRRDDQVKLRGHRIELGEIEATLRRHPAVAAAAAVVRTGGPAGKELAAYVTQADGWTPDQGPTGVASWQRIFDEHIYVPRAAEPAAGFEEAADPLFDTIGWRSHYGDQSPIPLAEMVAWAQDIVSRVAATSPSRVLEIGCGTGMLLFGLAPRCKAYHGTEISERALSQVAARIRERAPAFDHVRLERRAADDFDGIEPGAYDTVILSSVVQYFPSVNYLLDVLAGAVRALRPGGVVVLADLRERSLLRMFHTSVCLAGAEGSTLDELAEKIDAAIAQETELFVDSALFDALPRRLGAITGVEVHLQRGAHRNELNAYRYHAVLHVDGARASGAVAGDGVASVDTVIGAHLDLASLERRLASSRASVVRVENVPNARLARDAQALERFLGALGRTDAGSSAAGLDPDAMYQLGERLGYAVMVRWSATPPGGDGTGNFDAVFVRAGSVAQAGMRPAPPEPRWEVFANQPVAARSSADLRAELRSYLNSTLPAYMVPGHITVLDTLPTGPTGKLDREALVTLDAANQRARRGRHDAPTGAGRLETATERRLAVIWCDVLGLEAAAATTDFFDAGGNSLMAVQLTAGVHAEFGLEVPLRRLFEAPTLGALAAELDWLAGAGDGPGTPVLDELPELVAEPGAAGDPFPLTPIQQAYWLGRTDVFELGRVAAHLYFEQDHPALDLGRYEAAWRAMIERHPMLRCAITPDGRQRIMPVASALEAFALPITDLSSSSAESESQYLDRTRRDLSHQVLDTSRPPLFDIRVTQLRSGTTRLHVSFDALIADAHSLYLLFTELSAVYADPHLQLPALDMTFRDYVMAHERLRGGDGHAPHPAWIKARDYWLERVDSLPPGPAFHLARQPASIDQPTFTTRVGRVTASRWSAIKALAREHRVTPSGVLLAAFCEVLDRWTTSRRFTVNLTTFNRSSIHPDVNRLVGDFTSLTLFEADLSEPVSFVARAQQTQRRLWRDLEHRLMDGVVVMREMARRTRSGAGGATVPVVFTSTLGLGSFGQSADSLRDLGEVTYSTSQTPQVWLDHGVMEREGELLLIWSTVDALFGDGMPADMLDAYCALLDRLADQPDSWNAPVGDLVPARQLAARAAANATEHPISDRRLHDGFFARAIVTPDAEAVIATDRRLTYAQLASRAERLAAALAARAVGAGSLVAIVMQKGWEQVVAVLGILRVGAAYLPIDASFPAARIDLLLADAQVRVAVSQPWVCDAHAWPSGIEVIGVSDLEPEDQPPDRPLDTRGSRPSPDDLAYVIYTSGSTGAPKGVMISHRSAMNTLDAIARRLELSPSDRVLAVSSLSFDLSVWDVLGVLGAGGAVVIPADGESPDPDHWAYLVASEQVTVWNSVPALVDLYLVALRAHPEWAPAHLRHVMMSGDWIPLQLPACVQAAAPNAKLYSLGGATEASIWSIIQPIEHVHPSWSSIPYGRPLANQRLHVLDDQLRPRPDGVPGELYIGGLGLAIGYWGAEELTAARFIEHPRTGERLYRTGDMGRYMPPHGEEPGGTLEFLGRQDLQVKIGGRRIELAEIEAALAAHPLVREAVVTAPGDRFGPRHLVAYVVASSTAPEPELVTLPYTSDAEMPTVRSQPVDVKLAPGTEDDLTWWQRRSQRAFGAEPLSLATLGEWMSCLGSRPTTRPSHPKYRYGSAGHLYAVDVFVHLAPERVSGLSGGLYEYDPQSHGLRLLAADHPVDPTRFGPQNLELIASAGLLLYLVANLAAVTPLYDDAARDFCLIEAGAITQLLETAAPAHGVGVCQLGGMAFETVHSALRLDPSQVLVHTLAAGCLPVARSGAADRPVDDMSLQASIRAALEAELPSYMVPSSWVFLDKLPLGANGKVDRQALPEPRPTAPATGDQTPRTSAATDLERTLVRIVSQALDRPDVAAAQSFFDIGADSMDVVRLHQAVMSQTGREFPLVVMFETASVTALAKYLTSESADEAKDRAIFHSEQRAARRRELTSRRGRRRVD